MKGWHIALIAGALLLIVVVVVVNKPSTPRAQLPFSPAGNDGLSKLGGVLAGFLGSKAEAPSPGYVKPGTAYVIPGGTTPEAIADYNSPEKTGQQVYGIAGIDYPLS